MSPKDPQYEIDQAIEDTIRFWIEQKHKDEAQQQELFEEDI